MIEAYAFFAAFTLQILATSVLYPALFVRYVRVQATRLPAERLAQLYPGVDLVDARERFLKQYRGLNVILGGLGLLVMAWLFGYMRRPDWDDGPVEILVAVYFLAAQMLPLGLVVWLGVKFNKEHKRPAPEPKRKAVLQRRGLFDFVSPFAVCLAAVGYLVFAAFVIYLYRHPFPGFAGLMTLGAITLVYAVNASVVYLMLYGKKMNPLETHAGRLHTIGVAVKSSVYSCIIIVMYLSLNFSLVLLNLQRWEPFALSMFFLVCALLTSMSVIAPRRYASMDELGPTPAA